MKHPRIHISAKISTNAAQTLTNVINTPLPVLIHLEVIHAIVNLDMNKTPSSSVKISMNAWSIMVDAATVVRIWLLPISAHVLLATNSTGTKKIALIKTSARLQTVDASTRVTTPMAAFIVPVTTDLSLIPTA